MALNRIQRHLLEATLSYNIDPIIKACNSRIQLEKAFSSITNDNKYKKNQDFLNKKKIKEEVDETRKIYSHPCPQNRRSGDPQYYPEDEDPETSETVYTWNPKFNEVEEETKGLLGLTAKNEHPDFEVKIVNELVFPEEIDCHSLFIWQTFTGRWNYLYANKLEEKTNFYEGYIYDQELIDHINKYTDKEIPKSIQTSLINAVTNNRMSQYFHNEYVTRDDVREYIKKNLQQKIEKKYPKNETSKENLHPVSQPTPNKVKIIKTLPPLNTSNNLIEKYNSFMKSQIGYTFTVNNLSGFTQKSFKKYFTKNHKSYLNYLSFSKFMVLVFNLHKTTEIITKGVIAPSQLFKFVYDYGVTLYDRDTHQLNYELYTALKDLNALLQVSYFQEIRKKEFLYLNDLLQIYEVHKSFDATIEEIKSLDTIIKTSQIQTLLKSQCIYPEDIGDVISDHRYIIRENNEKIINWFDGLLNFTSSMKAKLLIDMNFLTPRNLYKIYIHAQSLNTTYLTPELILSTTCQYVTNLNSRSDLEAVRSKSLYLILELCNFDDRLLSIYSSGLDLFDDKFNSMIDNGYLTDNLAIDIYEYIFQNTIYNDNIPETRQQSYINGIIELFHEQLLKISQDSGTKDLIKYKVINPTDICIFFLKIGLSERQDLEVFIFKAHIQNLHKLYFSNEAQTLVTNKKIEPQEIFKILRSEGYDFDNALLYLQNHYRADYEDVMCTTPTPS